MADQKISQLSSIGAVDNAADLFPIVDTSASETKKITPSALKTALALNNVDNTSDLGKPVSTATQTALDGKQDALGFTAENVANKSTSVVTDQASSVKYPTVKALYDWAVATFQAAIGYTPANKAGETFTGPISATNLSGTNTGDNAVNSLYSGLAASKEDVANKSTSVTTDQASNTKYPSVKSVYDWVSAAFQPTLVSGTNIKTINGASVLGSGNIAVVTSPSGVSGAIQFSNGSAFASDAANLFWDDTNKRLGVGTNAPSAKLQIKGSGSTSATTSLLVQNSAGTEVLKVTDDGIVIGRLVEALDFSVGNEGIYRSTSIFGLQLVSASYNVRVGNSNIGSAGDASAMFQVDSTTKGFLPPRMTTTQKNAIASPAAGLVVYDSTTNKLCCYNGSTWNDLF